VGEIIKQMLKFVLCVVQFPEITRLQIDLFRKFSKQSVSFVILDDSKSEQERDLFKEVAKDYQCEYFQHPWNRSLTEDPSRRHGEGIRYAMYHMQRNASYYGIIDSDILLLNTIDFEQVFQASNILMHEQIRGPVRYPWPGLCIWKEELHLENASWDPIKYGKFNTDSGGGTFYHLQSIKDLIKEKQLFSYDSMSAEEQVFSKLQSSTKGTQFASYVKELSKEYNKTFWIDVFTVDESIFLHLRDISNWQKAKEDFVQKKIQYVLKLFEKE
jgi:hypothetical protein